MIPNNGISFAKGVCRTLVLLSVILTGCSRTDVLNDADSEEQISFSAFADRVTRAEIKSGSDLATEGGFVVWGYKNTSTAETNPWSETTKTTTVFDKVNVKSTSGAHTEGGGTNWTYDEAKYWDKTARYWFYAVAPFNPASGDYTVSGDAGNTKRIVITGARSGKASDSDDFLVHRSGISRDKGKSNKVDFTFHHVMSKLVFKVKRSVDVTELKITSLKMSGFDQNTGTFVETLSSTPASADCSEWTLATAKTGKGTYTLVGTGATQTSISLTTSSATDVTDKYIVVPQEIAADKLTFSVEYTVKYSDGTTDDFSASASLDSKQIWGTDSQTTYTLTIGPSSDAKIKFGVTVSSWTSTQDKSQTL